VKIEVIRAWPRRFECVALELPPGSVVADALKLVPPVADEVALAIHGVRATPDTPLVDGDRIELLRSLQADPKDARRRRAQTPRSPR
jgi:putative ubiquitin-RnfH superfamily antitoxin RatB of RatAB toxin-antitoxin module